MWKVYDIETGKTLKAGFDDEDVAKEWLDARGDLVSDDFAIDEMDEDEEDEFLAREGSTSFAEEDDEEESRDRSSTRYDLEDGMHEDVGFDEGDSSDDDDEETEEEVEEDD